MKKAMMAIAAVAAMLSGCDKKTDETATATTEAVTVGRWPGSRAIITIST